MKKRKNIWLIVGAVIASLLLLYWLFAVTLIQEDENMEPIQIQAE